MRRSASSVRSIEAGERSRLLPNPTVAPKASFGAELLFLAKTSLPVALSYMLQNSLQTFSVLIVGTLGSEELSCAAVSFMVAMCSAWCVGLGGTTAVDTLASAIFTSSNLPKTDVGMILQRCFLVLGLMYIPCAILFWFSAPVLLLLGQPEVLAVNVQIFLRVLSFGAPGYIAFESVKKFLQVQGIMHASTMVLLVTSPMNVALNYLMIYTLDFGLIGSPLATSITYWISFFLLCAYCKFVKGSECWGGWDRRCCGNLGAFFKLAIAGFFHVGTEWWAFEIVALAAGRLGDLPLAAQSIIMTADQTLTTLPFGIGVAASARIGNLLGSNLPAHARISTQAAVALASIVGTSVLLAMMSTRDIFGYLFTDESDVVALVADVLPYVAFFQVSDGWAQSCGGVLRGMGKQNVGAGVNLLAYYLFAIPLGLWLAFRTPLGLSGLWIGQCLALSLVGIGEYILVSCTHWEVEVEKSNARLECGTGAH